MSMVPTVSSFYCETAAEVEGRPRRSDPLTVEEWTSLGISTSQKSTGSYTHLERFTGRSPDQSWHYGRCGSSGEGHQE
jgi:hypothetical protein